MSHKVEFRYADTEGGEFAKITIERREVTRETELEVDEPLARDVVCNEKVTDPGVEEDKDSKHEGSVTVHLSTEAAR